MHHLTPTALTTIFTVAACGSVSTLLALIVHWYI